MGIFRIEVFSKVSDTRAQIRKKRFESFGFAGKIQEIRIADVYTIEKTFSPKQLQKIADIFTNPVTQNVNVILSEALLSVARSLDSPDVTSGSLGMTKGAGKKFSWAIEIGFLPGVTDNVGNTAKVAIEDFFKIKFHPEEGVYSSQLTFFIGNLSRHDVGAIAESLANPLIHRIHIKNYAQYKKQHGMDITVPKVKLGAGTSVSEVCLDVSDRELKIIGKYGIANPDKTRRGPLALSLPYMKKIQAYFKRKKRNPTDIELESLAQTWSEHCKHTIFANPIDELKDGLFKTFIKGATDKIRKKKGKKDFCVSVFKDNSGAIEFDKNFLITHKVETHNTPSALDPFGGAITGIVGVNRDAIGFGLGAKPIANYYGFCLADPRVDLTLYKDRSLREKMLSSRRIMEGVIEGVNAGGNQSGIPTPLGFVYFDERYRGKPLVFVGTIGLIPKKINGQPSYIKKARLGDYIVMAGGRVGKDGIHGATFSSEALDSGSPVTAVQIGDPITQKKLSDAIVKEARDLLLYTSITDNGAGGLSCSVAEMAKESGGCKVNLEKVPLKYPGLEPWEIWVSESQERMTLAVPKKNWQKFKDLLEARGVEATIIGEFTDSGRCVVTYHHKTIMDVDLQFLHEGLPKRPMKTNYKSQVSIDNVSKNSPSAKDGGGIKPEIKDLTNTFLAMLERLNITSFEFISQQYDHIVQGNLVLGPLEGRGRVNSQTAVIKPIFDSNKGIVMSAGLYPNYSDIDPYYMAAACIDTAVRNVVATGADLEKIALLDNFCWCSSGDPYRLEQLKQAAKACYDLATFYQTPFISGKDSMFNDFEGFDKNGKPIKISIPPTLLITSLAVVDDIKKVVSFEAKFPGDLIYLLGETFEELGASEYFAMERGEKKKRERESSLPKVNAKKNKKLYQALSYAVKNELIASSIGLGRGGLAVALAKMAIGGMLGIDVSLKNIPGKVTRDDFLLFSESQGRIIVTVTPQNKRLFEKIMAGNSFSPVGEVTDNKALIIRGLKGKVIVKTDVSQALKSYKATLKEY